MPPFLAFFRHRQKGCQASTEHFEKQMSKHFWIWGFAPSPHQRAFVFDCLFLPLAATTENLFGNL
ncbi:MAG: hypothetical protein UDN39_00005, partial [Christensenellales bacterium]|nr:hypothetical protein [Christensenellales bacterium]